MTHSIGCQMRTNVEQVASPKHEFHQKKICSQIDALWLAQRGASLADLGLWVLQGAGKLNFIKLVQLAQLDHPWNLSDTHSALRKLRKSIIIVSTNRRKSKVSLQI